MFLFKTPSQIYVDLPTPEKHFVLRLIGGTGSLEGIRGAGIMHIKAVSPRDREFSLDGEAVVVRK